MSISNFKALLVAVLVTVMGMPGQLNAVEPPAAGPTVAELLATGLQLVEIETENGEEPTCELICAPGGTVPVTIGSAPKLKSRIVIREGAEAVYDSGPYVKNESGATVKVRGNSTATQDKKSFKLKLQAAADLLLRGDDARYADKEWVLLNHGGYLSTAIGFKVNELVGLQWTPGIRYVNVTVNGDYRGLYILCEAVTRNPSCRLDVAKKDGFVFEYDVYWWNEDAAFQTSFCDPAVGFSFKYPDSDDIKAEQVSSLSNVMEQVWVSICDGTYPERIDVGSWASWLLAHDLLGTWDWGGSNIYLTKYDLTEGSKVMMGNLWDFDSIEVMTGTWSNVRGMEYFVFDELLANANSAFSESYKSKWAELRKTFLVQMEAYITDLEQSEYGKGIGLSQMLDDQRWGTHTIPTADELIAHRVWFQRRVAWMDEQLGVPPDEPPAGPAVTNTITYVGLEGAANTNATSFTANDLPLALGPVEREGWRFLGWTPDGGVIPAGTVTNVTFAASWEEAAEPPPVEPLGVTYEVAFDANGGEGTMADQKFVLGEARALSPNGFSKAGHLFAGWATEAAGAAVYADGATVSNLTAKAGATVRLFAVWASRKIVSGESKTVVNEVTGETKTVVVLPEAEPEFTGEAASVYEGLVMSAAGDVVGMIQVKAAKANKKSGISKLTATMQLVGEKKLSLKGGEWGPGSEYAEMAFRDGRVLMVAIGAQGLVGTFGEYKISGSVNSFSSKDKETKEAVKAIEDAWVGAVNVVGDGIILSVAIAKKGKVKVSGTVNGEKVSASSQLIVGEDVCCVPVVIAKKANRVFNLWLNADGSVEITGLAGASVGKADALKSGAAFRMDGVALSRVLPGLLTGYLPGGLSVAQSGAKWVVAGGAKAGKLKLLRGTSEIDREKSKFTDNMSGLKLTYKAKDGSFKGSFKVYALENGKIKSYTANVTGMMVGDVGYGTATLRKPYCQWRVRVE